MFVAFDIIARPCETMYSMESRVNYAVIIVADPRGRARITIDANKPFVTSSKVGI
jgi:hypothetical protein